MDGDDNLYTVIEIGTENTKILIGRQNDENGIEVLGYSSCHSNYSNDDSQPNCIRKGDLRNLELLGDNLKKVIHEVEYSTKVNILDTNIYIGATGSGIEIRNEETTIRIDAGNHIIMQEDEIEVQHRAREAFQTISNGICLETYTRYFNTDSHNEIFSAAGQASRKLTGAIQGIILTNDAEKNMQWIVGKALGSRLEEVPQLHLTPLYQPLAMPYCVLSPQSGQETTLMIDIGAGVTSVCMATPAGFLHSGHLPVGCNHIENDLMQAFKLRWATAKSLVRKMSTDFADTDGERLPASVMNPDDRRARTVIVEKRQGGHRDRIIPLSSVEKVVALRLREIFQMVRESLQTNRIWRHVNGTIYLSGGGAMIPGVEELASQVLGNEVVLSHPSAIFQADDEILNDPRYVIPLGLMRMAVTDNRIKMSASRGNLGDMDFVKDKLWSILKSMINW